jgi:HEPN domain-containing protein
MNRATWQQLAEERARDALALLHAGQWSGAYYLAGHAVECGLKSCIIVYLLTTDRWPERKFSEQCWAHDLAKLLELAGLKGTLDTDAAANPVLSSHWGKVKDWTEASRYQLLSQQEAAEMTTAVTDPTNGVLPWIRQRW